MPEFKTYDPDSIWARQNYPDLDKSVYNDTHREIIKTVEQLINPEQISLYDQTKLRVTSAYRNDGGAHTQGIALDVSGEDTAMFRLFEKLCVNIKENPAIGLGVMLGYKDEWVQTDIRAQRHLHIIIKPGYYLANKFGFELVYIKKFKQTGSYYYNGQLTPASKWPGRGFPIYSDINDPQFKTFLIRCASFYKIQDLKIDSLKGEKILPMSKLAGVTNSGIVDAFASTGGPLEKQSAGFRRLIFKDFPIIDKVLGGVV